MRKEFRFFIWLLLSTGTLVGLMFLRSIISPTPEKPEEPKPAETQVAKALKDRQMAAARAVLVGGGAGGLTVSLDMKTSRPLVERFKELAEAQQRAAVAKLADAALADAPEEVLTLGEDDASKLLVKLSLRGGAVKTITMKVHRTASVEYAQPLDHPLVLVNDDDDGKLKTLSLKQRLERQSFRFLVDGAGFIRWRIQERKPNKVVFVGELPGKNISVTRTFELPPGAYHLNHNVSLAFGKELPAAKADLVYELTGPRGLPVEGLAWKRSPFRQAVVGTVEGKDGGAPRRQLVDARIIDPNRDNKPQLIRPADEKREVQYAGIMVQYFAALIVVDGNPSQARYVDTIKPEYLGDDEVIPKGTESFQGKLEVRIASRPIPAEPGNIVSQDYLLFAGPVKVRLLNFEPGVAEGLPDRYENELHIRLLTDAPSDNWFSRMMAHLLWNDMIVFFTNKMHWLLEHLVKITRYYGIAIILLTVIVRACMFPISRKQALASLRMQKLAPELKKLQEKYKEDRQALAQAQMKLYREKGVNPLSGCLVILLQMPIFLGLYYALNESIHLRLAGFLWIDNLAVPDAMFNWRSWPVMGQIAAWLRLGDTFNLLPLVSIALMLVQQRYLMPPPADEQQAMQMKMMNIMMIFMAYMFYWVAAGLCVYFVVSGAWGLLERKLLPKLTHDKDKPTTEPKQAAKQRSKPSPNGDRNGTGVLGRIAGWCQEIIKRAEKK